MSGDLLIRGGLVADPRDGTCAHRDILIRDGIIAAVRPAGERHEASAQIAVHDATDRLIIPGLINAHTHGHANLMKGVADRWSLEASLTNGPWLGGGRDPEIMYLSTLLGAVDMISKGCTACFDLVYEFPRPSAAGTAAVARAYADAGMRAVLAPMVADRSLFQAIPELADALPDDLRTTIGAAALAPGQEIIDAVASIFEDKDKLPAGLSFAIAPTIPHHCSDEFMIACASLAERHGLPIHMHIAESRLQAVVQRQLYGVSAARHLANIGLLRPGFVAAHSVWLDDDDLDLLASHKACVAHIPASNYRLGSGIAHVRAMLERGITVGLATDGANSSDALNMFEAMRLASFSSRVFGRPRNDWLSAQETFHAATVAGAIDPRASAMRTHRRRLRGRSDLPRPRQPQLHSAERSDQPDRFGGRFVVGDRRHGGRPLRPERPQRRVRRSRQSAKQRGRGAGPSCAAHRAIARTCAAARATGRGLCRRPRRRSTPDAAVHWPLERSSA